MNARWLEEVVPIQQPCESGRPEHPVRGQSETDRSADRLDNQVEASDIGWLEDNSGGPTFQIVQGTVMVNSTVIAVTAIPRHSQVTPTPGTPQPLPTAKP